MLKSYLVVTPEYGVEDVIPGLGCGPMEYGCDCIEVEAENARDAKAFGVKLMLQESSPVPHVKFEWCKSQKLSGESPYTGVKVEPYIVNEDTKNAG
jgi:hypothetical protein